MNKYLTCTKPLETLVKQVIAWADESNTIKSFSQQDLKLMTKYGELCDSIAKNDLDGIKKGIGDVAIITLIMSVQQDKPFSIERYKCKEHYPINGSYISLYVSKSLNRELKNFINKLGSTEWIWCCLEAVALVFGLALIDCIQHAFDEMRG